MKTVHEIAEENDIDERFKLQETFMSINTEMLTKLIAYHSYLLIEYSHSSAMMLLPAMFFLIKKNKTWISGH